MSSYKTVIALTAIMLSLSGCAPDPVRQDMITRSQKTYSGICSCPYTMDRGGRMCGERSAYSRLGPSKVLCYGRDISDEEVEAYKKLHPEKKKTK